MVHLSMGVSDMMKFLIKIAVFFAIVAVVDFSLGKVFYWLQSTKANGRTHTEYYVCNDLKEDILIMGSSRASHHYVAQMIADSLGMDGCYNGGQDGNGIVLQYGRWKMISKHHLPKVIIYDIEPAFDLVLDDNARYIDRLKPFADDKDVNSYITNLYKTERLKLESRMYRYNYKFLEFASDCVRSSDVNYGYIPNKKNISREMIKMEHSSDMVIIDPIDNVKIDCLKKFINEAGNKGIKVILVSSPYWKGHVDYDLSVIKKMAAEEGVPFIDFATSEIRENSDWFADSMHLNEEGAKVFTRDLCYRIKAYL